MENELDQQAISSESPPDKTGESRDEQGRFIPGISGNPHGRPVEATETKALKKAMKEIISDYKEKLSEALPELSPILIGKAKKGDLNSIKEIHDRVMGKPQSDDKLQVHLPTSLIEIINGITGQKTDS